MKKLSLLALAAAGLLLGACSDKDEAQQTTVNPGDFKDGAFIGISLSLPTVDNTTRANDELNNGTADEFTVYNATLYIFEGTLGNEDAATYVAKYSLGTSYVKDDQDPGDGTHKPQTDLQDGTKITSTSVGEATKISNELAGKIKAQTKDYFAYVVINNNGLLSDTNAPEGITFKNFSKLEFGEIGADIAAKKNIWPSGLLMTSAPTCNYGGGTNQPTKGTQTGDPEVKYSTLVHLDPDCVFGSAQEAIANPAACVYVERAAVKITVVEGTALASSTVDGKDVKVLGWQVINNEPKYYNTRHINNKGTDAVADAEDWGGYFNEFNATNSTKYRFVSINKFVPTLPSGLAQGYNHTTAYRTYFAFDPHYSVDAVSGTSSTSALANTVASETRPWISAGEHAYTTENTFDVKHQTWQNTTMVTLKVQIGDGTTDYYTVGNGSNTLLSKTAAEAAIHNIVLGDPAVSAAAKELMDKISANHTNLPVTVGLTVTISSQSAGKTDVPFTIELAYKLNGSDYTAYDQTDESNLRTALMTAISNFTTKSGKTTDPVLTSYYKSGISYYNVRIKHFGDNETPWSLTHNANTNDKFIVGGGSGVNEIYFGQQNDANGDPVAPTDAQTELAQKRFLGRYGVVRDNWYKLSIDKISKIGDAEPVDPSTITPDTPDDEIENYIAVHVHIVPWALREQTVQF